MGRTSDANERSMDAAKAIAAFAPAGETDIWPFVLGQARASQLGGALPIAAIPTPAATASAVTPFAVILTAPSKESRSSHSSF